MPELDLASVKPSDFEPHVEESFRVVECKPSFELRLASVDKRGGDDDERPFSLVFEADTAVGQGQGTYRLEHDALGIIDLFLVPVFPGDAGCRFEAVFT